MNKEEFIRRRGVVAYEKKLQQGRDWAMRHRQQCREELKAKNKEWSEKNPEKVIAYHLEANRKGGKRYEQQREYDSKGLPHDRKLVRMKHAHLYRPYKKIIASASQIHHQWLPDTANYTGLALVEADQHMHGYIDVIQILEGKITLFTEAEIRVGGGN